MKEQNFYYKIQELVNVMTDTWADVPNKKFDMNQYENACEVCAEYSGWYESRFRVVKVIEIVMS